MKISRQSLIRSVFGLLLVSGVATAAVASSAKPAQAGVVISIGFGGGYAPVYRPYPRPYAYFHHRRYVPAVWLAPPIYPGYRYPAYGYPYGYPVYGRPYGSGYARFGYGYGRGPGHGYYYGRPHGRGYGYGFAGRRY